MTDKTDRIRLRPLQREDAQLSWIWRNDEDIRDFFSGHPFFINKEQEEEFIEKALFSNMQLSSFGVEEISSGKLIGMSFLKTINPFHRHAQFSIFIGDKEALGKGYSIEATRKTLDFAFDELNLHRINVMIRTDNEKSLRMCERCGFRKEGIMRESLFKNGAYRDEFLMSILRTDR